MNTIYKFCYLIFVFNSITVFGQNQKLDSMLTLLKTQKDDTSKVNLLRNICGTIRFTNPAKAIEYGKQGVALSKKLGFDKGTAGNYLNLSTAYTYSDRLDSALYYLNIALQYSHKVGDSNRLGLAYLNRADIFRQLLNFTNSLKDCELALKYADQANNNDVRARINQTIGSVYLQQNLYPQALIYYKNAIVLYEKVKNKRMIAVTLNNMGLIYKNSKKYEKAIGVTKTAIQILDSLKDITNLCIFNTNLADVYFQSKKYAESERYGFIALEYAQVQNNEKLIADAQLILGSTFSAKKQYSKALVMVNNAMTVFKKLDYTDKINSASDLLIEVYANTGNYTKAYENLLLNRETNDSLLKWRYDDDISAMQTKFKVDEKDKEIKLLATEKELQNQKLNRQRIILFSIVGFVLLAGIGIWQLFNRRKLKEKLHDLELRNQIAADLHDEVGSSLSSIQMLSQMVNNQPHTDEKEKAILQKMSTNAKETVEKMSDIVWMIKPGENDAVGLGERMQRFLYEIGESKNITCNFTSKNLDLAELTMGQRKNIYLIFKEAVNNAVKYSGTSTIDVLLIKAGKQLSLTINDFGKGFDIELIRRGNGLENMQNRAKELGGKLTQSSEIGKGTWIKLELDI